MRLGAKAKLLGGSLLFAMLVCPTSFAQVVHLGRRPRDSSLPLNTITVSVSSTSMNLALVSGGRSAPSSVTVTTSWLLGIAATVRLYGSLPGSTALTSSSGSIPSSTVSGQVLTGWPTSWTPFTSVNPMTAQANSLKLFEQYATVSAFASRNDVVSLAVDLTSQPQLPAATYTGTITFQAQAF